MQHVESFLRDMTPKTLARVVLVAFGDDYAGGRAAVVEAFQRFGHRVPKDVWAFATDGKIRDSDLKKVFVREPANGAFVVAWPSPFG